MHSHHEFLIREFFSMSLQAATQHIRVYAAEAKGADRKEVQTHLRDLVESKIGEYRDGVTEDAHVKNIEGIVRALSRRHAGLLAGSKFPFSSAQKALNLYLKYMWCAGFVGMPPHCPVDAFVLRAAKLTKSPPWTKMATVEQYRLTIEQLKLATDGQSLAEWELEAYNASDA